MADDTTWSVGTRKGLFFVRDDVVVQRQFLGEPVTAVLCDSCDGSVYVALDHGHFGQKLHRSDDAGATFAEITAPRYPPEPEGLVDIEPIRQLPVPWNVELIWSLAAGHAGEPGVVWCGTIPLDRGRPPWAGSPPRQRLLRRHLAHRRRRSDLGGEYRIPVDGVLAVTRTRDGGATFEVERPGLAPTSPGCRAGSEQQASPTQRFSRGVDGTSAATEARSVVMAVSAT